MSDKERLPEEHEAGNPTGGPRQDPSTQPPSGAVRSPSPPQATRLNKLALVVAAGVMSVTLLVVAFLVGDSAEQDARAREQREQADRVPGGPATSTFYDRPPAAGQDEVDLFTGLSADDQAALGDQEMEELARATEAYTAQYQPPVYAPERGSGARGSSGPYYQSSQRSTEEQALERALRSSLSPQGLALPATTAPQVSGSSTGADVLAAGAVADPADADYLNTLSELRNLSGAAPGTTPFMGTAGTPQAAPSGAAAIDPVTRPQAFLQQAARSCEGSNYIATSVQEPISPFELREGTLLEAFLITGIHSDLPGEVVAQVSRNVYDSQTQQTLLVPKGTRLIGTYDNAIALDQSRLLVAWTRMVFPDGRSVNLPGLHSKDLQGANGLAGKVNRHYWRAFGNALMLAIVGGSLTYATSRARGAGGVYSYPTPGEIAAGSVATELSRVATEILRGNVNRRPTIRIKEGTPFNVFLNGDLSMQPYAPRDGFLQRSRAPQQPAQQITRRGY